LKFPLDRWREFSERSQFPQRQTGGQSDWEWQKSDPERLEETGRKPRMSVLQGVRQKPRIAPAESMGLDGVVTARMQPGTQNFDAETAAAATRRKSRTATRIACCGSRG
jgi:hypothetical protein